MTRRCGVCGHVGVPQRVAVPSGMRVRARRTLPALTRSLTGGLSRLEQRARQAQVSPGTLDLLDTVKAALSDLHTAIRRESKGW